MVWRNKPRELWWKPLSWLGTLRPTTANDAWDPALWQTFFSSTLGFGGSRALLTEAHSPAATITNPRLNADARNSY